MKITNMLKLTFWKSIGIIIMLVGAYSSYIRFTKGLGASTNLTDSVPWGLWIGFDFIGVGLAAAGFTIAASAHIFNSHKFEPIVRPAVLTAYIGYMLVVLVLVIDLGRPENFWHPLIMWNHHSVMFEITWCVICYSTILSLEFAPVVLEKYKLVKPIKILRNISIPVVVMGVLFSTLHQSSFGSLYLIMPTKVYPLWYSSILPVHFFVSCIAAGLSMIIFESYIFARSLKQGLDVHLLSGIGKVIGIVLLVSMGLKFADFAFAQKLSYIFIPCSETYLFWLEIILGSVIPVLIFSNKNFRVDRQWLYFGSVFTLCGFVLNRMNVSITSLIRSSGQNYTPSFEEISITLMIIVIGMWAFNFVAKNFKVFPKDASAVETTGKSLTAPNSEIIMGK